MFELQKEGGKYLLFQLEFKHGEENCYTDVSSRIGLIVPVKEECTLKNETFRIYTQRSDRKTNVQVGEFQVNVKVHPTLITLSQEESQLAQHYHDWVMWLLYEANQGTIVPPGRIVTASQLLSSEFSLVPLLVTAGELDVTLDLHFLDRLFAYKGIGRTVPDGIPEGTIVAAKHNQRTYILRRVRSDMTLDMETPYGGKHPINFREFSVSRYGVHIFHRPNQPLFELVPYVVRPQNVLMPPQYATKPLGESSLSPGSSEFIPSELCYLHSLQQDYFVVLSYMPSILYRIQCLHKASQVARIVGVPLRADLALEATTTPSILEDQNYENLETLGDSFLKLAVSRSIFLCHSDLDEGSMTQKKCDIVSNKTLDNLMRTKGVRILPLVRTTRVSLAKAASPPSSPPPSLTTKMRADVAEALVGAYYVDGGEEAALAFLRWLCVPLPNDFEFIMLSPVSRAMAASALSACHSVGSTGQSLNHRIPLNGPLLEEALTHASVTSAKSNQRLEFLGDAVLDFIITTKLWEQCPNLSPGLYTELRSRIVCNRRLAMLAVDLELVDRIRHDSESLRYSINRFVKFMTSEHTTGEGARTVEESYPKVLADVVEAVIGALYLEKCCSLKAVWRILKPHLIGDIEYAKRIDGKCVT